MNIAVNSLHFNGCRHNPVKSQNLISFVFSSLRISMPGMCGAELFPAGRGEEKNPRGGAKVKIRGAGRGKRTRKLTDPKIRQKCVYCYGDFCSV